MEYLLAQSPHLRTSKNVFPGGVEGSWTPVLTFEIPGDLSVSYHPTIRYGHYQIFGHSVTLRFGILTTAFTHTTAAGGLIITGIPVNTAANFEDAAGIGAVEWAGINLDAGYTTVIAVVNANSNFIFLDACGDNVAAATGISTTEAPSGNQIRIRGSVTYRFKY